MRGICLGLSCALLVGCGGSGGGGGSVRETPVDLTLTSVGAIDGFVGSDGSVETTSFVGAGDNAAPGLSVRGFYRFDLSAIPDGALITCAIFDTYQALGSADVYFDLGDLAVDWVELGNILDASDFDAPAIAGDIATLSTGRSEGRLLAVLTDTVQACLDSNGTHLDLRLRFPLASDGDGVSDLVILTSAEEHLPPDSTPTLMVSYLP